MAQVILQQVRKVYANGYEAVNVAGGMKSWQTEGRPMTSELPGAEPEVL
jgi:rhodanese-related sulfurtransferase